MFLNALNSFATVRKKYLCANHSKFVNKELYKAMKQITKPQDKFLKQEKPETRLVYENKEIIA